ncbi:hypothetical protein OBBRIDRAFT_732962, partial [Obba rivulosa]
AILCYDYCLTFSLELERFWKSFTLSWASALFIANRYLPLLSLVPILMSYFREFSESVSLTCQNLQLFHAFFLIITQSIVGALLGIRIYALYNRSRRILALLFGLGLVGSILAIVPPDGTGSSYHSACALDFASDWGYLVVVDTLVFILTVIKAVQSEGLWKGSLFLLLLRDGACITRC